MVAGVTGRCPYPDSRSCEPTFFGKRLFAGVNTEILSPYIIRGNGVSLNLMTSVLIRYLRKIYTGEVM